MSPTLALILCTIFVVFLLRLESKRAPDVSLALWIPTIWMLCTASKPLGIWFETAGADMESGSPLDRTVLGTLLCLGLLILAWRKFNWAHRIKEHTWLTLLIGYMLISILWSDIPFISFKRWVRELTAVIMAFLLATEASPQQAMESIFRRTSYILIPFSVLLVKYFPSYGVAYSRWEGMTMWVGVTLQKNSLGRLCLISAFFLVWTLVRRWQGNHLSVSKYQTYGDVIVLVLALWLLKGPAVAYSATAFSALAVGLATFKGLLWMKKRHISLSLKILAVITVIVVGFGIVTPIVGGSNVAGFTSLLGRDATLTGRTTMWARLVPIVMRNAIFGYGFGGYWTTRTREANWDSEAHNGYLDVFLELGIVGLAFLTMFLLSCCGKFHRKLANDFDWGTLCICYLVMAVLHNITESSINNFTSQLTAVLLFLSVSCTAAASDGLPDSEGGYGYTPPIIPYAANPEPPLQRQTTGTQRNPSP